MSSTAVYHPTGKDYLNLVTDLLHRQRLLKPTGGVWEAADMQWAWRHDQRPIPEYQTFWLQNNTPVAALVISDEGDFLLCDLIFATVEADVFENVWTYAVSQLNSFSKPMAFNARDDENALVEKLTSIGFIADRDVYVETWMNTVERPAITPLAEGFQLLSRSDVPDRPHHMIRRNGEKIAERLAECSLYNPDLDLVVYAPKGDVAAYILFWADPVTKVGLVEPVRTEDAYQRLGLARHLLTTGINRLASYGCDRVKVSYSDNNEISKHLYISTGFKPLIETRTYRSALLHR